MQNQGGRIQTITDITEKTDKGQPCREVFSVERTRRVKKAELDHETCSYVL